LALAMTCFTMEVDAIGEALGVDTGIVSEHRMAAAMEAARRVLVNRPAF